MLYPEVWLLLGMVTYMKNSGTVCADVGIHIGIESTNLIGGRLLYSVGNEASSPFKALVGVIRCL